MIWLVAFLAGFSVASAFAYHRWRLRGLALLGLVVIAVELLYGTITWYLPHPHFGPPRRWEWACHATSLVPAILILTAAMMLALHVPRHRNTTLGRRVVIAGAVTFGLAAPLVWVMLWWVIGVLGCDTM